MRVSKSIDTVLREWSEDAEVGSVTMIEVRRLYDICNTGPWIWRHLYRSLGVKALESDCMSRYCNEYTR